MAQTVQQFLDAIIGQQGYKPTGWDAVDQDPGYVARATIGQNAPMAWDQLLQSIAGGQFQVTPESFDQLFTDRLGGEYNYGGGLQSQEFGALSPEVQAWARQNPQQFIASLMKVRNPANGSLLSIGAEGGFANPELITAGPNGLNFANAGYMPIKDQWYDGQDFWGPLLVAAAAGAGAGGFLGGGETAAGAGEATVVGDMGSGSGWMEPGWEVGTGGGYAGYDAGAVMDAAAGGGGYAAYDAGAVMDAAMTGGGGGAGGSLLSTIASSPVGVVAKMMGLTKADGSLDLGAMVKAGLITAGALGGTGAIGDMMGGGGAPGGGGGGPGGGSFSDAAWASADASLRNMLIATAMNRPNQSNPYGSVTWEQDPETGQWTSRTEFSPEQDALYQQSVDSSLLSGGIADMALLNNYERFMNPINFDAMPEAPIRPGQTAYDAMMSRLEPQIASDRDTLATKLANQGIDIGSRAYAEANRLTGQRENDLRLQAASQSIPLDMQARKDAMGEQVTASQLPLSNISTLRQQAQPQMPNFGQTWTPAGAATPPDLLSAAGMQSNYNLGQQNLQTAQKNANMQGLFGIGTSLLGSNGFWNWLGG
jgi:hypothetical protein